VSVEIVALPDGRLRAFNPGPGGIVSAISGDALTFAPESGQRFAGPSTNPAVSSLSDGRLRMIYGAQTRTTMPPSEQLFSTVSADGSSCSSGGTGRLADPPFASVPNVARLADGSPRLYYTHFESATPFINVLRSARSTDQGVPWTREPGDRLAPAPVAGAQMQGMGDPCVVPLPDGRYRMFYTRFVTTSRGSNQIESAISEDGSAFTIEGTVLSPAGTPEQCLLVDPFAIPLPNDRYRRFYRAAPRFRLGTQAGSPARWSCTRWPTPSRGRWRRHRCWARRPSCW